MLGVSYNFNENEMMMAFAAVDVKSLKPLDDPAYVEWFSSKGNMTDKTEIAI